MHVLGDMISLILKSDQPAGMTTRAGCGCGRGARGKVAPAGATGYVAQHVTKPRRFQDIALSIFTESCVEACLSALKT